VFSVVLACDHYVGFSLLLDAYARVCSGLDKAFAVSADLQSVLFGQSDFRGHGYFSGKVSVSLCKLWVLFVGFVG